MTMSADKKARLMRWFDGKLMPDEMMDVMVNDQGWFPFGRIARGEQQRAFRPRAGGLPDLDITDQGRHFDLYDYLSVNAIAGMVILKDGEVAFETYQRGISADPLWHSCSVAKSVASTLVGIAIKEGRIGCVDELISRYVDIGGVYANVTIRQLLRMTSGVEWNEDYGSPASVRRRVLDVQTRASPAASATSWPTCRRPPLRARPGPTIPGNPI